jgi:hypothetical protein
MAITLTTLNKETAPSASVFLSPTRAGRPSTQKRGLRGAFASLPYIGPIISKATAAGTQTGTGVTVTHTDTIAGGGTEDSKGYRKSDTYDQSGNTGGLAGAPATSVTRPNPGAVPAALRATQAYIGEGVQAGSRVSSTKGADVIDAAGRANDTGVDRFGRARGVANVGAGAGWYTYTNFDGRSMPDGEGGKAAGIGGRGTSVSDETVTVAKPGPPPTFGGVAAGVIALADLTGAAGFSVNIHADDVTGGANGRKGAEIVAFTRGADTEEDLTLVGYAIADGTQGASGAFPGSASRAGQTLAVYARFLGPGVTAPGTSGTPTGLDARIRSSSGWSLRGTIALT